MIGEAGASAVQRAPLAGPLTVKTAGKRRDESLTSQALPRNSMAKQPTTGEQR
jgi:hypothetical protein